MQGGQVPCGFWRGLEWGSPEGQHTELHRPVAFDGEAHHDGDGALAAAVLRHRGFAPFLRAHAPAVKRRLGSGEEEEEGASRSQCRGARWRPRDGSDRESRREDYGPGASLTRGVQCTCTAKDCCTIPGSIGHAPVRAPLGRGLESGLKSAASRTPISTAVRGRRFEPVPQFEVCAT